MDAPEKNYKCILVDDDQWALIDVQRVFPFDALGFEVIGSYMGVEDAYAAIKELKPHLVITDVCLGDKNGLDLISKCIRDGYEGEFLIISGYSEFEYARRAIEWDVSTYLLKPLDEHECREALEKVVCRLEKKTIIKNDNDIVDRIRSYIHKNYQHKLPLEEMASEYHMNRTYFSEFFRKNFGKTFVQYKTEVRIEHAKVLLKNSDDLVQDISAKCGFENVTYFIQQFKEMTGDSPEQYRKRQR